MTDALSHQVSDNPEERRYTTPDLEKIINAIAVAIAKRFSPGEVADLRKLRPDNPGSSAFWRIVAEYLEGAAVFSAGSVSSDDDERRWAIILSSMAHLRGLHLPRRRIGHALADAGLSELRFGRLLRARDEALFGEVRHIVHYLASKAESLDCADLASLLLHQQEPLAESIRRSIARDYYWRVHHVDRKD